MDLPPFIIICFLLLTYLDGVFGITESKLITELPGQDPRVSFRQYCGYIDITERTSFFYYFVEAEKDPLNQPLTIWLAGGPGCSSASDAFLSIGPFHPTNNGRALQNNPFSWNKVSNLLFVDSPIGAGWSYTNTSNYINGDDNTSTNLLEFILKWYEQYNEFKSNVLFIAGTSYGGHFAPNLASTLLDYNSQAQDFKFNLKGVVIGNPRLRWKLDDLAAFDLLSEKRMIDYKLHHQIKETCNTIDENNYPSMSQTNWTTPCQNLMTTASSIAFSNTRKQTFDVLRDFCSGTAQDLEIGKEVTTFSYGVEMCRILTASFYFTLPEVQEAFHGNRTKLSYPYRGCRTDKDGFIFNESDRYRDMLPTLKKILQQSVRITIMSGDQDGRVPPNGTSEHLGKLAEELNLKLTEKKAWNHENEIGGWMQSLGDLLTLFAVKDGNHHVAFSQPSKSLYIFKNLVLAFSHPRHPRHERSRQRDGDEDGGRDRGQVRDRQFDGRYDDARSSERKLHRDNRW